MNKSLFQRVGVAIWGVPLILMVSYLGGIPFAALITGLCLLGMDEFYSIQRSLGRKPMKWLGFLGGLCILLAWFLSGISMGWVLLVIFLVLTITGTLTLGINYSDVVVTFAGIIYIPFLMGSLIIIRDGQLAQFDELNDGRWLVICIWGALWMSDTAAYFGGKKFGRNRVAPHTSPKKTWEGSITGFIGSILFVLLWWRLGLAGLDTALAIGLAAGLGGQIGDLFESKLKREAGVKDASNFLPGHGGVLDRFDSTLIAAPLVALYLFIRTNYIF